MLRQRESLDSEPSFQSLQQLASLKKITMSTRKRKLPPGVNHFDDGQPAVKRQRLESHANHNTILDVINVRDIIFDYLDFNENVSFLMHVGNDHYFERRLLGLKKSDVNNIQKMTNYPSNTALNWNVELLCALYANIKVLFGDNLFAKLLKIESFTWPESVQIDNDCNVEIKEGFNGHSSFICSMILKFETFKNISTIFTREQKEFLTTHNIHFSDFNQFTIQILGSGPDWMFEILPKRRRSGKYTMFGFVLERNKQPRITMVPISNNFEEKREFHTQSLLPSIERIFITKHPDCIYNEHALDLHLDHDKDSKLNKVWIRGQVEHDFRVNIRASTKVSDNFELTNLENKCDVKFDIFCQCSLKISQEEINFIQKVKGMEDVDIRRHEEVEYTEHIIENGTVHACYLNDTYFFEIIGKSELQLVGCGITSFHPDLMNQFKTSEIPAHWKILRIGKAFCPMAALLDTNTGNVNERVSVTMDAFSSSIKEFSITQMNVHLFVDMDYKQIPDSMEIIRLPYHDYDFIMAEFPFFVDHALTAQDLPPKQVEFKFYEMLFSEVVVPRDVWGDEEFENDQEGYVNNGSFEIGEDSLEKLINPLFNTRYDNEIVIYCRSKDSQ